MTKPGRHRRSPGTRHGSRAAIPAGDGDVRAGTSDEAALVSQAQAGDHTAFEPLVHRHSPRLRGVLSRITRDAEITQDALQEALLRAWQNIDSFQGRSSLFT
jgi:hypothetical protein